ncbi:coiled-coil domain-containing protein 122 isoform X2 [Hyperolius riggenbachi]|uniref:coiled-coil domain-containing protein 122 isoform X2 n=1 Tax=Hyperolius riggenbachi TaxID=752182 RepID=UPI0035A352B5
MMEETAGERDSTLSVVSNPDMTNSPSLAEAMKQLTQQQKDQATDIENRKLLISLKQTELCELETDLKSLLMETKEVEKKINQEEDTTEKIMLQCGILETEIHSIYSENIKLKQELETQKEDFQAILLRNNKFRERIEEAILRFSEAENKLPVMIELIKKRDMVRLLRSQKEEMILDLHNPGSTAVKQVQDEMSCISEEIKSISQCITARKKTYEQEKEKHVALRKEIEVQKKRYDAILKRLHSQLNNAQMNRRQYQWNIAQMEKTASGLRESLGNKQ